MDVFRSAPAFFVAAAWLAGLLWVFEVGPPPLWLSALGLGCALAASGRAGALPLAAFFAALLVGAGQRGHDGDTLAALAGKTVEVNGRALGHADGQGERVFLLETASFAAGGRVHPLAADILVVLGRETSSGDTAIAWGDRLRLRGTLLAPSAPRNGTRGWPGLYRLRVKSERLAEVTAAGGTLDRLASLLRRQAEQAMASWQADPRAAGFLRCLLLGDRSELPEAWARAFNAVGLGHALSVSGFHISLFFLIFWGLTSFFPYRLRWLRLLLLFVALAAYLLLVGPRPAALRAGLMGLAVLAALIAERPAAALNSLAIAAILLTLDRPQLIVDISFQLTVLATFGIAAAAIFVDAGAAPWRRLLASGFGAELATLPLLLPRTATWHPLGFLFNAFASPWLGLLISIGLLYFLAAALTPWATSGLAHLFAALCTPLDLLDAILPSRFFTLPILHPGWAGWSAPAWVLGLLLFPRQLRWLLLLGILACQSGGPYRAEERLEVAFLDVGQGDATLLIDGKEALLVDGGGWRRGDPASRMLIPALVRLGITRLSALALSHGDLDHCGGPAALGSYWPIAELWASGDTVGTACGRAVADRAERWLALAAGDRLQFGRWRIEVLWPPAESPLSGNDASLVLRAWAEGHALLLTGDIEKAAERRLLASGADLAADLLKVAHHGSRTSSTAELVAAVAPRWSIVSAGEGNSFGHPAPEVVARLERNGLGRVLRTDRHGLVRFHWPRAGQPLRLELAGMPTAAYRMPR